MIKILSVEHMREKQRELEEMSYNYSMIHYLGATQKMLPKRYT